MNRALRIGAMLTLALSTSGVFGITAPIAHAATSPSLGTAESFSILAGSEVTNTGATTISGDVGISPGTVAPNYSGFGTVTHGGTIYDADATALEAQDDKNLAYTALASQGCDTDYGAVTQELAGLTLNPGVYCATSFHLSSGTLTLNGSSTGVWIFKSASDLIITGSSAEVVFTGGGLACNVWWRVVSTATFDAGSAFVGNILADTSITMAAGATLDGRALARTAEVTLSGNAISGPTCTAAPASATIGDNTITVIKQVINDNGGTATFSDFPLFVNGYPVTSGKSLSYPPGVYTVTETGNDNYTATFGGNCDANGVISHGGVGTHNDVCTIVNDDIGEPIIIPPVPPLIDVVKVPTPLALPDGEGSVVYNFTLRNIGTVPVTDITMVDDSCTPAAYISGDENTDDQLDVDETWTYRCTRMLTETHTNNVIATGWANGLSTTDIASATVIVGEPIIPPLIHVTKIPSPLTLFAGGGMVTYTETITNPGTVPLDNVTLTDDKCAPVSYISGDVNEDGLLDADEAWIYVCQSNLTATTTNTATATGEANDITVRDIAVATVVVASAVPSLPNTGAAAPIGLLFLAALAGACAVLVFLTMTHRLHRK